MPFDLIHRKFIKFLRSYAGDRRPDNFMLSSAGRTGGLERILPERGETMQ